MDPRLPNCLMRISCVTDIADTGDTLMALTLLCHRQMYTDLLCMARVPWVTNCTDKTCVILSVILLLHPVTVFHVYLDRSILI